MSNYLMEPVTVRPSAQLQALAAFDTVVLAPPLRLTGARSGLLIVTYTQGTATGAGTYPRLRIMAGPTAASLFALPIEDASAPVNVGYGTGLQTDLRVGIKALRDDFTTPQAYPVNLSWAQFYSFQFAEFNGSVTPGTLLAQLIVELDH